MDLFSKKILNIEVGIVIFALGIAIGVFLKGNFVPVYQKNETAISGAVSPKEIFTQVSETATSDLVNPHTLVTGQNPQGVGVKVERVIDGDTIEIEGGEKVRYIGIDTPETVDPRKTVQCFGVEASKKNKELVEGKMVRLEKDITDRDKYNRLLRYVYLKSQINADIRTRMNADKSNETFVNLALVEQGFAKSYSYPPDIKYQEDFRVAERKAREEKIGLWGACPVSAPSAIAIPAITTSNANGNTENSCKIKGNISASGEKIYHLPDCGSYIKTQIDEARGEKWFCSETEALSAGWRKAGNCS